jgi:hypothetical protein
MTDVVAVVGAITGTLSLAWQIYSWSWIRGTHLSFRVNIWLGDPGKGLVLRVLIFNRSHNYPVHVLGAGVVTGNRYISLCDQERVTIAPRASHAFSTDWELAKSRRMEWAARVKGFAVLDGGRRINSRKQYLLPEPKIEKLPRGKVTWLIKAAYSVTPKWWRQRRWW